MPDPLSTVTPIVLTFDEEANIGRCLESLRWARRVIVLDSGSRDGTHDIARSFGNVDWHVRPFDSYRGQWSHAVAMADTPYALALDADMAVTPEVVDELRTVVPTSPAGGIFAFDYRYDGRSLLGSICAPQLRLFRTDRVEIGQVGHGHRFTVDGRPHRFAGRLIHDDRKSFERWISSQIVYSRQEADRISARSPLRARDVLRRSGVAPLAVGLMAFVRAGGPLSGKAAVRYALERATFEALLGLRLTRSDP